VSAVDSKPRNLVTAAAGAGAGGVIAADSNGSVLLARLPAAAKKNGQGQPQKKWGSRQQPTLVSAAASQRATVICGMAQEPASWQSGRKTSRDRQWNSSFLTKWRLRL
jgi:hypothetical protein